jgi:hypothetical protein
MRGGDGMIERQWIVEQEFINQLKWIFDQVITEASDISKLRNGDELIAAVYRIFKEIKIAENGVEVTA